MKTINTWKGKIQISTEVEEILVNTILESLFSEYTTPKGEKIKGQSVSYLLNIIRNKGIKNIGQLSVFEEICEGIGFKLIREARNERNQKATIVTI